MASKLLDITQSILFIDPTVKDYQTLVRGINHNIKIVLLDTYRDGIQQITETLVRNQGVKAVHILSHGTSGCLYLGNSELNLETIENYTEQLQQWGQRLDDNADILIYGCKVAADLVFIQKLQELTGANIAASATPTGNARLGGDWNLEVSCGKVSTPIVFSAEVCQAYSGRLAQINVGITDDNVDGDTSSINALLSDPGTDGEISLREAIIAANNTAGDDTINLVGGETYTLTITGSEEDNSETGDLDIKNNGEIVIQTLGNVKATIDAGGISGLGDRVFNVIEDASLKLENAVVTGGVVTASFPYHDDNGGGILVNAGGTLELTNSTISGNSASNSGGGIGNMAGNYNGEFKGTVINIENSSITDNSATAGGGITNVESVLNITNSIISSNSATSSGGGIIHQGAETIDAETNIINSTISGNFAKNGGGIAGIGLGLNISDSSIRGNSATNSGGGINAPAIAQINNSTINNNSAEKGGGIYLNRSFFETVTISNSTISGNSATEGGGILNYASIVAVNSSTISGNTATSQGSGLFNSSYYSSFEARTYDGIAVLGNSIIAGNYNNKDIEGDGNFTSNGYNLIGNDTIGLFNQIGDQTGNNTTPLDPQIGPLQDNGGPTETHALLANSPAIDAGNTNENNDQRGAGRDSNPDIGAFEFGAVPIMIQEPNDTLLRATHTGLTINNDGTFSYSGEIGDNPNVDPEKDVDLFKVDLDIGDRLRLPQTIDLLDESDNDIGDAQVQIFDSLNFIDFPDPDDGNYIIYQAKQAGTFYVGISGDGNSGYDLNIEGSGSAGTPGKYDLTIETIGRQTGGTQSKLYFSQDNAANDEGLYILDTTTGDSTLIGSNDNNVSPANVGLAPSNSSSFLYGGSLDLLKINADGSATNSIGGIFDGNGLAYDPTNNIIYGVETNNFFTINPNTGNRISVLDAPPVSLDGLSFGNGGVYGLGESQDLLFYDPNSNDTNKWTTIGDTGISSWQDAGLAFDAEKNVLYAKRDGDTLLYEIDVSTAQATSVGNTGISEGGGLALVNDDVYEEPNDTIQRATHTGLTQNNHGTFSFFGEIGDNTNLPREDDVDLFEIHLDLGETVRIPKNIQLLEEYIFSGTANAEVRLFDDQGTVVPLSSEPSNDYYEYTVFDSQQVGTFYVGISGDGNTSYNSNQAGSGSGTPGKYGLTIETIGRQMGETQSDRLFAVKDDGFGLVQIVELNPQTGEEINSLPSPETLSPGSQGLAYDGNSLFLIDGSSSNTELWELDPDTGEVRDSDLISSPFTLNGLAALDGKVYILDSGNNITEFDPVSDVVTNTLDIDAVNNGVSLGGRLGAIAEPNALLAIDFNSPRVLEINPTTGAITNSFPISYSSDGIAVIDNEIYVGKNDSSPQIEVFDRSGTSQRTMDFDYNVSALGGDNSGAVEFEEPNDTRVGATHTGLTRKNHGTFNFSGKIGDNTNLLPEADVDLFEIHLDLGERVRLPVNIELLDESGNYITNAEVQLFDATGSSPLSLISDPSDPTNYRIYDSEQAGTFYVGISSQGNSNYDPNIEGDGIGTAAGNYNLTIETIGREMGIVESDNRLFAFKDDGSRQIVELNPLTGAEINSFSAPDTFSPGPQGLAFDGNSLFFVENNGSSTELWELNPDTGGVRDNDPISDSGGFDGLAVLEGKIYILDTQDGDIIEFDPVTDQITNTLDIDGNNIGVSLSGGLAGITGPNALLATNSNSGNLVEINPDTGIVTNSFIIPGIPFINNGVAVVDNEIYVSDNSTSPPIGVFNRAGVFQRDINLNYSVSALAGDNVGAISFEEPNDTLTRATHTGLTLTNPGTYEYSGEIGDNTNLLPKDDVDLFKFDLDTGETVTLPGTIQIFDENGNPAGNAEIQLFDSTGNPPLSFDTDTPESKIYQATATGTFYVGISGSGSITGNYDLTIETTGSRTGDEPNDTIVEATDTGLTLTNSGVYTFNGEIGDNTNIIQDRDVDIFKFDLDIGETATFDVSELLDQEGFSNGIPTLRLFDSTGFDIGFEIDPSDSSKGSFSTPEAGTFYLGVSSSVNGVYDSNAEGSGSGDGNFYTGSYDLTIETIGRSLGNEEANDTITDATDTGLTLTNSGVYTFNGEIGDNTNIIQDRDVDIFKFDLDIGETATFDVSELLDQEGFSNGIPTLRLFDSTGFDIGFEIDPSDSSKGSFSTPEAGTFYLGVSSSVNGVYDSNAEGSGSGDGN
ncbi:MAG: DUF4347 domain-containing protein, partial [Okeania sp. SIO3I5]|uniref:DUF4347 domain-containing protein n=1 Tax=Okeania sp. SIO3I5 TaxID=2607805 RepID=UPI0013BDDF33